MCPDDDSIDVAFMQETRLQVTHLRKQLEDLGSAAKLMATNRDSLLMANQEMAALAERVVALAEALDGNARELERLQPGALSKEHSEITKTLAQVKASIDDLRTKTDRSNDEVASRLRRMGVYLLITMVIAVVAALAAVAGLFP